ncbi:MAG: ATP phosphoribosyltransferase [Calditrichaeota bacterium]|nr:MAG: ATP phosphoribosyltransferase [Calditrichota bacterium]
MITLAIQKSGRLSDKTKELLRESGIHFENGSRNPLKAKAVNFPLQILSLRDDDIPEFVADGGADAGIVGQNVCLEKEKDVRLLEKLGFARCRLSVAVPNQMPYHSIRDLAGLKIATSYPRILRRFLEQNQVQAEIHEVSGSVEIAPGIGFAQAIFDIVSTGSTLMSNGLKEVVTVVDSEAVLIARPDLEAAKQRDLEQLLFRFRAVKKARNYKYILLNAPNEAIEKIARILPGMKSPTVMPLALPGWSSVHSVVEEDDFWEVIEGLRAEGAQGILVVPIEKMII